MGIELLTLKSINSSVNRSVAAIYRHGFRHESSRLTKDLFFFFYAQPWKSRCTNELQHSTTAIHYFGLLHRTRQGHMSRLAANSNECCCMYEQQQQLWWPVLFRKLQVVHCDTSSLPKYRTYSLNAYLFYTCCPMLLVYISVFKALKFYNYVPLIIIIESLIKLQRQLRCTKWQLDSRSYVCECVPTLLWSVTSMFKLSIQAQTTFVFFWNLLQGTQQRTSFLKMIILLQTKKSWFTFELQLLSVIMFFLIKHWTILLYPE